MKLTKMQIDAIVDSVFNKFNNIEKEKEFVFNKENLDLDSAKKIYYELTNIHPAITKEINKEFERLKTPERIAELISKKYKKKIIPYSKAELKTKIIIESISCKTIDELKKKLNLSY